jgi:hypothetical protein
MRKLSPFSMSHIKVERNCYRVASQLLVSVLSSLGESSLLTVGHNSRAHQFENWLLLLLPLCNALGCARSTTSCPRPWPKLTTCDQRAIAALCGCVASRGSAQAHDPCADDADIEIALAMAIANRLQGSPLCSRLCFVNKACALSTLILYRFI